VRDNGTVVLPLLKQPLPVQGKSIAEAEDAMREAYVNEGVLPKGKEKILVSLMQARQYKVVVVRQESPTAPSWPDGIPAAGKRGTGLAIDLPAYENDVLHALVQTGGLPGLDAYNEIIIHRAVGKGQGKAGAVAPPEGGPPSGDLAGANALVKIVRIPLRLPPGAPPPFGPEDVLLHDGDVVFLEARDDDVFYTAGLLPGGVHPLPRDHDLDVVEAVSLVKGPLVNGGFATNNLAGNIIEPGVGAPSPSLLTVLRRTPCGRVVIRVDLNKAMTKPQDNLLVRAGDILILQEQPSEALARWATQTFANFSLSWQAIHGSNEAGVLDISTLQRIPSRIAFTNFTGVPVGGPPR
jgi:hypothetical protein